MCESIRKVVDVEKTIEIGAILRILRRKIS